MNMKKLLGILFVFVVHPWAGYGQVTEPQMLWLRGFSGNSHFATPVTPQADGGFILAMSANMHGGNIDSFCSITGNRAIYFKFNSDASVLEWTKCYEGTGDTLLSYIFPQSDSGIVFGGEFQSGYGWGFYICKQDELGNIIWSHSYSKGNSPLLNDMIATNDGGYIMLGVVYYTDSNFTVHNSGSLNSDIGIIKLDSTGNKQWSKAIGGSLNDVAYSVTEGPHHGYYIIGSTISGDFDGVGNHGGADVFVVRLDSNGNIIWHKEFGGSGNDDGNYGWPDGKGGVLVAASNGSNNGDVTHYPSYDCPIWVLDVDSTGSLVWNNCYGGGGLNCYPNSICRATDGSIWVAGVSTLAGGLVDSQYGRDDAWFLQTDSIGNFINGKVLGSSLDDRGMIIFPLTNGNVIGGGFYGWGDGTFPGIFSGPYGGVTNAFLAVFTPNSTGITVPPKRIYSINMYPNPSNDILTLKTNISGNCETIITDMTGRVIYKGVVENQKEISVREWQKGIYFLIVIDERGNKQVQKIVIV